MIRTVNTQVVRSVRRELDQALLSDGSREPLPLIRTELNVNQVIQILKYGYIRERLEEQRKTKNGKKRTAPDVTKPRKRIKIDFQASSSQSPLDTIQETKVVQVYSHVFELGCTRSSSDESTSGGLFADDQRASEIGWLREEAELIGILSAKSEDTSCPWSSDLGEVAIEEHYGVMRLFHGSLPASDDEASYDSQHLLTIPTVPFSNSCAAGDLLYTCRLLQHNGDVAMTASARLFYLPNIPAPCLPLQINVTISVSLVLPTIFTHQALHAPHSLSMDEKRRRFLNYLFCPPLNNIDMSMQEIPEEASIRQFYSILKPAQSGFSSVVNDALQPNDLRATLLPFQKRSVKWLLEREFKTIDAAGRIVAKTENSDSLPLFWTRVKAPIATADDKGKSPASYSPTDTCWWYYNRLTGSLRDTKPTTTDVLGGMLCEEMGLGKTLECLALILLSPASERNPSSTHWDEKTEIQVSTIKSNLIVTPSTLSQQWLDEIERHAPSLKVLFYNGYKKIKLPKIHNTDQKADNSSESHQIWSSFLHDFDVVVTTYQTLRDDLGIARAPIIRPKRQAASYSHVEKPRSPLVRVEWARVFMDEVQLVGGGKTAEMVSLLPRKVSIAVSGTPARSKVSDLSHVLKFLRVSEAIGTSRTWDSLLKPEFKDLFADLFRKYAIRTLKSAVRDELTIPPQRRFAIGIELGKVEKHIYDETLQDALDELGVDARGVAASQGWELDITLLRTWLRKLRQICTHPQVGQLQGNKTVARASGGTSIKTMQEVLQDLQSKTWQSLTTDLRGQIQLILRQAQLMQKMDEDVNRFQDSRDLLYVAQTRTNELVEDIKIAITAHEELGARLKEETAIRRRERKHDAGDTSSIKGKERAREVSLDPFPDGDSEGGLPHTRIGEEYRSRQRNLQSRLREALVLKHKVAFLLGDVYHVLGASAEDDSYALAEAVRKSILKTSEETAALSMHRLLLSRGSFVVRKKDLKLSHCQKGGIRSAHIMEETDDILDLLNEQTDLLWEWRARVFTLLTQTLSASEGQADGEEYGRSLDTQGEVEAYIQAYAALIADRKEALIAERTALATHDAREMKSRHTFAARKAMTKSAIDDDSDDELEGLGDNLEDKELQQQLANARNALIKRHGSRALKTTMFLLSAIGNRAGDRSEENQIAREEGKRLRNILTDQGNFMEKLELELASFRKVFNDRIQYFKQLQELSDTVVEVEWEGDVRDAIRSSKTESDNLITIINRKRAQLRHLQTLAKDEENANFGEVRDCVLCRSTFKLGLMTPCAHVFCERCLMEWLKAKHADCPVCRSKISVRALQRISLNNDDTTAQNHANNQKGKEDQVGRYGPVVPDRSIQFNTLPRETLDEIQTFEVHGSFGSKITHLVRHLLCIQNQEPGTKSVLFSAWSDSLTIIEQALLSNGINCIRVDQQGKQNAAQKFKTDPGILVFLLHGERENAGLNLTCAKRVWLIEPTVNHSFEVQAISRVDRMGQTAATEVFCYYIEDTVEENILRMGAKRGFSLYVKNHAEDVIDISEFSMGSSKHHIDSSSKKAKQALKGDFVEREEDLIHVLFPHLDYQDEDFTDIIGNVSKEGAVSMDIDLDSTAAGPSGSGVTNAVAGPSRLR